MATSWQWSASSITTHPDDAEGVPGAVRRRWLADLTDADGRMALDLGVTGPPETFFVDADGIVRYRHVGPLTADVLAEQLPRIGVQP